MHKAMAASIKNIDKDSKKPEKRINNEEGD
jgi:hypothetical protein